MRENKRKWEGRKGGQWKILQEIWCLRKRVNKKEWKWVGNILNEENKRKWEGRKGSQWKILQEIWCLRKRVNKKEWKWVGNILNERE